MGGHNPRSRVQDFCARIDNPAGELRVDFARIVQRLILFDTFIVKTVRLSDVAEIARVWGLDSVLGLLRSGAVRLRWDFVTFGETGDLPESVSGQVLGGPLPRRQFRLSAIRMHDAGEELHRCLQQMHNLPFSQKQVVKLKRAIADAVIRPPDDLGSHAEEATLSEFAAARDIVREALVLELKRRNNAFAERARHCELKCEVDRDNNRIAADTDLGMHLELTDEEVDGVLRGALLAVAALNQRIEEMERYEALSGFQEGDLPVFESKLAWVARQLDPTTQLERFERVLEVAGLPAASSPEAVDVARLLEIRASPECEEFRRWIQTLDSVDDKELEERVASIRARFAPAVTGGPGKVVRLVATTALDAVPLLGPALSIGASALDTFLVDRFFASTGPVTFLTKLYPSIFR